MGTYSVTPTVGDVRYVRDYVSIWAEGQSALGNLSTNKNQFGSPSFVTTVTDGQLTLRIADGGGVTSKFAIAALDIVPVQSPVPTPTSTPTPMPTAIPSPSPTTSPTTLPTATPTPPASGACNGSGSLRQPADKYWSPSLQFSGRKHGTVVFCAQSSRRLGR